MTGFLLLNDPASHRQWLVRAEHVCAAEVRRADGIVVLHLTGGEQITLTHEESREFVRHAHPHPAPTPSAQPAPATPPPKP